MSLLKAIEKEDIEEIKGLLLEGESKEKINEAFGSGNDDDADIDQDQKLQTPLTLACQKGNIEVVKALVETGGADVNKKDKKTIRPLYQACLSGNQELVTYLVSEHKADVNKPGWNKFTPVFAAVEKDDLDLLKYLVSVGADLSVQCSRGGLARHAAYRHLSLKCLDYLIDEQNLDVNTYNEQFKQNILYEVCMFGRLWDIFFLQSITHSISFTRSRNV